MRTLIKPVWVHALFTLVASFTLTALVARPAHAQITLWRFYGSNVTVSSQYASTYRTDIASATTNYDGTRLTASHVSTDPSYTFGTIRFYTGNYGLEWVGKAEPYNSDYQLCVDYYGRPLRDVCNMTKQVRYGYVFIDTADAYWLDGEGIPSRGTTRRNNVMRHEMGHIFGLEHPSYCEERVTVMRQAFCTSLPSSLTTDDHSDINGIY